MKKILVISSLLVLFIFLVSCLPQQQITDEELETELAKLTPEQREQLLKDLESKDGGALAGQAVRQEFVSKYGISKTASMASAKQIKTVAIKLSQIKGVTNELIEEMTIEKKATEFCKDSQNAGKKTHYCSEFGSDIKYDKFRCSGIYPIHEIDTTYKKSLLYPDVDTCQEILTKFLDKPGYATIGCYDSDVKEPKFSYASVVTNQEAEEAGYVEIIQIQTGNKAPTASSSAANPIKEFDACAGVEVKNEIKENTAEWCKGEKYYTYGCVTGYCEEEYPPIGYVDPGIPCVFHTYSTCDSHKNTLGAYGKYLFERKCPKLFGSPAMDYITEKFNCNYETGYACSEGRCKIPEKYKGVGQVKSMTCKENEDYCYYTITTGSWSI
ncbi:MAG: hypothetical protein KKA62_05540 [Nanoarchaeota archaeon]|nr:hypothetical protein [Nanoarchaeota archaeon]MBU1643949.1 hypothetical protein [Nanoarchaeota archaeon]MBU1977386.1 hypothetical protein [Nanoarchaeota archaeon]